MARVRQFAKDLGITYNQAKGLINKGRSRKDGGSQILEKVMKPKKYKPGGSVKKSPVAKVKKTELDRISLSKAEKDYFDAVSKSNKYVPPKTKANTAGIDEAFGDNKKPKAPSTKKKPTLKAALERLKKKDKAPISKVKKTTLKKIVKKKDPFRADKTESLDKEFSKSVAKANEKAIKEIKKSIGGLQEIPEDNKGLQALAKKAPKVVERMGFKKMRGGGIAIQGTGFRGVK